MGVLGETSGGNHGRCRLGLLRRFARNRDGVTAIEFAFLGLPFFLLIFAILESCIAFAAQELLSNATDDVARRFRTGQIKVEDNIDEQKLRQMICDRISILVSNSCPGLAVDLQQFDTFEDAARAATSFNEDGSIKTKVDPGPALTKNMLRVYYHWPIVTNRLAQTLPDGKMLLFASMTWQNEPF